MPEAPRAEDVVLETFAAVEARDAGRLLELYHDDIEFLWPEPLSYAGTFRGAQVVDMGARFASAWDPVQPTDDWRGMHPRVVGASDGDVVVRYVQRGELPTGERIDAEVLGLYEVRDGRLARAQMFYFDPDGVERFLTRARS